MSDKEMEGKEYCAKCGILTEETLILTCDHDLCLQCAAKNLIREERKGIHKYIINIIIDFFL
jgi:hypothetical protein